MSSRGATSSGSLLIWGGEGNFLKSNSRIRPHLKAHKSCPKGSVSVNWQQAWRIKSPVQKLAFVDTLCHCRPFYWTVTYFLFHSFLPHWVHWREEQAVSVLIYFSCQLLCQPVVFLLYLLFRLFRLFRPCSECRNHIVFQSNCEMKLELLPFY